MAEEFTKENPNIVVKPVYTGNYADTITKVQAGVQGKNSSSGIGHSHTITLISLKSYANIRVSHRECSFIYGYQHLTLAFVAFYEPMID